MSHASQKLDFTLYDILRSKFANLSGKGWRRHKEVSLPFDHLRSWIAEATWCHLVQEGVLEGDNYSEYGADSVDEDDSEDDDGSEDDVDSDSA